MKKEFKIYKVILIVACFVFLHCGGDDSIQDNTQRETALPIVVSMNPANGAIDVAIDTTISVTFSNDMDATTITTSTFYLDQNISGTISHDATNKTAIFKPDTNLSNNTTYTATIKSDIKDNMGNFLISNYSFSFTTVVANSDIAKNTMKISTAYHTLVLKNDGTLVGWGYNKYGQLAGTEEVVKTPSKISDLSDIIDISAGGSHSLVLKSDHTVWSFGKNYNEPENVSGLTNIIAIAAGAGHNIVLDIDASVWAWGSNREGELGYATSLTDSDVPLKIQNLSNVVAINTKYKHNLALKSDGKVWAWGKNESNQLGNGTPDDLNPTPTEVLDLTDIIAISAGYNHSMALKSDGTVWTWGDNDYGQLGDNSTNGSSVPLQVPNLTNVIVIASGSYHSMALKSDGTVWVWGSYFEKAPSMVSSLTDIIAISGGLYNSVALQADGTIWTWGHNDKGQLGNGEVASNQTFVSTPFQIKL
jgi:alpha-tubulin suppressor-like RCC1 family protein